MCGRRDGGHDVEGEQAGDEAGGVADSGRADPDRIAAVAPRAGERDQVRTGGVAFSYLRMNSVA